MSIDSFKDIQKRFTSQLEISSQEEVSHVFAVIGHKSQLGLGARNIREFLSVAADYYIYGRDVFMYTYKKLLDEKGASALHKFIGEKVFNP